MASAQSWRTMWTLDRRSGLEGPSGQSVIARGGTIRGRVADLRRKTNELKPSFLVAAVSKGRVLADLDRTEKRRGSWIAICASMTPDTRCPIQECDESADNLYGREILRSL